MSDTLRAAAQQALEALLIVRNNSSVSMHQLALISPAIEACRAALAEPVAAAVAEPVPFEPLKGWKLNHVQSGSQHGTAEIGYLHPEDDHFSPIVTVDTGLYYQDDQAVPLARAILDALSAAPAAPPQREREPLTDEQIEDLALQEEFLLVCDGLEELTEIVRAIERAHGISAPKEQA